MVVLDNQGKRVKKSEKFSVSLYSREILSARRRLIGGFYAYDNQEKSRKKFRNDAVRGQIN